MFFVSIALSEKQLPPWEKWSLFSKNMTASGAIGAANTSITELLSSRVAIGVAYKTVADQVNLILTNGTKTDGSPGSPLFVSTNDPLAASVAITNSTDVASKFSKQLDVTPLRSQLGLIESDAGTKTLFHRDAYQTAVSYLSSLIEQKTNVSGVSLERETINLQQMKIMYEANLKVIQAASQMMDETINMIS